MNKQRTLTAVKNTILFSAITHLIILAFFSIKTTDITVLNYFNILDLDFFWPSIHVGVRSQVVSAIVTVGIVVYFYVRETRCE